MLLEKRIASTYLVMTNVDPEDWCVVITELQQTIGRSVEADIPVAQRFPHVSRLHAKVWQDRHFVKIRDLGSLAGTRVNGVWVKDSREATVALGDRIWMGGLELELVDQVSVLAKLLAETQITTNEDSDSSDTIKITAELPTRYILAGLSQAELEILLWMSRGYVDDAEIAKILHRSPNTIRTQVGSISRKLNVHSRAEIIGWLRRGR